MLSYYFLRNGKQMGVYPKQLKYVYTWTVLKIKRKTLVEARCYFHILAHLVVLVKGLDGKTRKVQEKHRLSDRENG